VELIFSRTDVTAADNCVDDDTNVARLDTTIEPYLQSLGLTATGSIETGPTQPDTLWCDHFGETLAASWSLTQQLAADGWTFASHSLDYPTAADWSAMTLAQMWDETCGSAQTIDAHDLPGGDSMFLWPNNVMNSTALVNYAEPCFGTNRIRTYIWTGATPAQFDAPPYQQPVRALEGGYCHTAGASCRSVPGAVSEYVTPATVIAAIQSLRPGQVLSLQSYLDVTGTNPAYTTSRDRWDCTSSDPNLHWTNDVERYCWTDLETILNYIASSGIGITQPAVVEAAFGRTGYSDQAIPRP